MSRLRLSFPALMIAAIAVAAGCGGGGGATPFVSPAPTATPTPHIGPTTAAVGAAPVTVYVGNGVDSASLSMPQSIGGASGTMTVSLSASPPAEVTPAIAKRAARSAGGSADTADDYVTVIMQVTLQFSSSPTMTFGLGATSIPTTSQTYLRLWDPVAGAWKTLAGPGTVSGPNRNLVTFNGIPTGQTYVQNGQYIYALVETSQSLPTATPAPTPTTTAMPTPGYCAANGYHTSGTVPLNVTDDAGLDASKASLILYVTNGKQFMDNTGAFSKNSPYPLPAACFANPSGGPGVSTVMLPSGLQGGRVYFAYGTPAPGSAVPNPMATARISGPSQGWSGANYPWDLIEYGTAPGAVIDTTQVAELGMPLELSLGGNPLPQARRSSAGALATPCPTSAPGIVGVTSCNFGKIFTELYADTTYKQLVVVQNFANKNLDMQVVAPNNAVGNTGFQWNYLATTLPQPSGTACPGATSYIQCVLVNYNTTLSNGHLFTTKGYGVANVSNDSYCVTSDGVKNFTFTDVGAASTCVGATPNPSPTNGAIPTFSMNVLNFEYGTVPAKQENGVAGICVPNILFAQPWGQSAVDNQSIQPAPNATPYDTGTGNLFAYPDAFAMWKALAADLNRGSATTTSQTHPVGITSPTMSLFFKDPGFNYYAYIIHYYFNDNLAYALAYDDLGSFESGLTWSTGQSINVRINPIPTSTNVTTQGTTPGQPNPCPSIGPGIGG